MNATARVTLLIARGTFALPSQTSLFAMAKQRDHNAYDLSLGDPPSDFKTTLIEMGLDKVLPVITAIQTSIEKIETRQAQIELSLTNTQQDHESTKTRVSDIETENSNLRSKLLYMESRLIEVEKQQSKIKDDQLEIKFRSMKNNLTFHNIPEHKSENTRQVLISFLTQSMELNAVLFETGQHDQLNAIDRISIARCHRFGTLKNNGPSRPIVAVFTRGKDIVLRNAKKLAGKQGNCFVSEQMPPELTEKKKEILPIFKSAKGQGLAPKFVGKGDAVLVQGHMHRAPKIPSCTVPITDILSNVHKMNISACTPILDQGNKFIAHIATVTTPVEISMAVDAIKHTASGLNYAAHNIVAARILQNGQLVDYCDDDGEHGGARRIIEVMRLSNITNRVIVVSRWNNGTRLGPNRFGIIQQCAKAVLGVSLGAIVKHPSPSHVFRSPPPSQFTQMISPPSMVRPRFPPATPVSSAPINGVRSPPVVPV